jgi:CRISPR/Cas system-associated protein Cas7 (RAMP superfamily)
MRRKFFFLILIFFFSYSLAFGQTDDPGEQKDKPNIFAVVKDEQGDILEGYLHSQPEDVTVTSRDNQEKIIPSKYIKSITLEKVKPVGPPNLDPKQETKYSVRLENSQEIYTLRKKYTFSLNTNVGVVTKSIDPETINSVLSRDASQSQATGTDKDKSFIQDKSIIFSLEFKF